MLKCLLIVACGLVTAYAAVTPAVKPIPTSINFVNNCPDPVYIASDPVLATDLNLGPGKSMLKDIPDFWAGELWVQGDCVTTATKPKPTTKCNIGNNTLKINGADTRVGNTRLFFSNMKPAKYYFDIDYGFSYTMRIIPGNDMIKDINGSAFCDRLTSPIFDCGKETLGGLGEVDLSGPVAGKQCLTPCAALFDKTKYTTPANFDDATKLAAGVKAFCSPDSEPAADLKNTTFYKALMYAEAKLNTVNLVDPKQVAATCNSTLFNVVISCEKAHRTRLSSKNAGPFFSYPFFYD